MLQQHEKFLLLQGQLVCKKGASIISDLPLDLTKVRVLVKGSLRINAALLALHWDTLRIKGVDPDSETNDRWSTEYYSPNTSRFTYEKASWRRYLRNHILS